MALNLEHPRRDHRGPGGPVARWIAISIAATVLALCLASEALLPQMAGRAIEMAFRNNVNRDATIQVEIKTFPAVRMLAGHVDHLIADISRLVLNDLRIKRIFLDAQDIDLDVQRALLKKKVDLRRIDRASVTVVLDQDDINRYIKSRGGLLSLVRVELSRGKAELIGEYPILGKTLTVSVNGHFAVEGATRVKFVIDKAHVEKYLIPKFIQRELTKNLDLSIDLQGLPVPFSIHDVRIEQGAIYVFGGKS
ncbi:MAG TPA: DUF2993 domain-containing protein [Firmicutes bacterium]|nr:DUF2993 domain-containing protein [Bacillota bacterium]